eukprot:38164_1
MMNASARNASQPQDDRCDLTETLSSACAADSILSSAHAADSILPDKAERSYIEQIDDEHALFNVFTGMQEKHEEWRKHKRRRRPRNGSKAEYWTKRCDIQLKDVIREDQAEVYDLESSSSSSKRFDFDEPIAKHKKLVAPKRVDARRHHINGWHRRHVVDDSLNTDGQRVIESQATEKVIDLQQVYAMNEHNSNGHKSNGVDVDGDTKRDKTNKDEDISHRDEGQETVSNAEAINGWKTIDEMKLGLQLSRNLIDQILISQPVKQLQKMGFNQINALEAVLVKRTADVRELLRYLLQTPLLRRTVYTHLQYCIQTDGQPLMANLVKLTSFTGSANSTRTTSLIKIITPRHITRCLRATSQHFDYHPESHAVYAVLSHRGTNYYTVRINQTSSCTCLDWKQHHQPCKHLIFILLCLIGDRLHKLAYLLIQTSFLSKEVNVLLQNQHAMSISQALLQNQHDIGRILTQSVNDHDDDDDDDDDDVIEEAKEYDHTSIHTMPPKQAELRGQTQSLGCAGRHIWICHVCTFENECIEGKAKKCAICSDDGEDHLSVT